MINIVLIRIIGTTNNIITYCGNLHSSPDTASIDAFVM